MEMKGDSFILENNILKAVFLSQTRFQNKVLHEKWQQLQFKDPVIKKLTPTIWIELKN